MSSRLPDTTARRSPENLAILLREPLRSMTDELFERLAERGFADVRAAHGPVFEYLDDAGTRVGVLAERAGVRKQSMAEHVAHLERAGYLERVPDPADGRARIVRTTARGREVFGVARELIADVDARLARRLGPERVQELRGLLEDLRAALDPDQ